MRQYKTYEELVKISNYDLQTEAEEYSDYYEPRIKIRKMKKEDRNEEDRGNR